MSNIIIKPLYNKENIFCDIEIDVQSKKLCLLGSQGKEREISSLASYKENSLAVFLGIGFAYGIIEFLERTKNENLPICIIDKEEFHTIPEYKEILDIVLSNPCVFLIQELNSKNALEKLLLWQKNNKGLELSFIRNSQYSRIDREYYSKFEKQLNILNEGKFWQKVQSKRFQSKSVKILFTEQSWLSSELIHACQRLGIEYKALNLDSLVLVEEKYINLLFDTVAVYKPDMIITFNHLGVDNEGLLLDLLAKFDIPLLSFFVDHPYLTLHDTKPTHSELLSIFTYDEDNVSMLKKNGYKYVDYMPLGTDAERFHPRNKDKDYNTNWQSDVSFVGSSMVRHVQTRLEASKAPALLQENYMQIASAFRNSKHDIAKELIKDEFSEILPAFLALDKKSQLMYERAIIWEATRQYRKDCVEQLLTFNPIIMGDKFWESLFIDAKDLFQRVESVSYFTDLPNFYPHSIINFNTTSMQMKNAVNQRVFDVMAGSSFVLTDWRSQMDNLFEDGKEIISYKEVGEIPELIIFYLRNEKARNTIVEAGRKRILAEHTWDCRLLKMIEIMKDRYKG